MPLPYRRILFATDLSEVSLQAWPHAVALAEKLGAELLVVTVIEEPYAFADSGNYSLLLKSLQEIRPAIEQRLLELAKKAPPAVRARAAVLESHQVARALLDHAAKEKCDLIVAATHGRGGIQHLLLGSVAEKLVRISSIPVFVLPPTTPR
ncbi:MAG TPA: universal stress protein [Planctomycetota bacterium]|jgi:nucleotide-binding universal stress UspA family protein|nr:universal stress protein [Planctomycetota bacterium]